MHLSNINGISKSEAKQTKNKGRKKHKQYIIHIGEKEIPTMNTK